MVCGEDTAVEGIEGKELPPPLQTAVVLTVPSPSS